ncbi:accessory gland protein Acp29AB-like isoform X2 [Drosophila sulfurigaster albostrigata]|uniref:accessory gland protein Acp29AB-like isoform X2 n=1 Tax=Drosophila sulfurigaster albostrigata TaxID=89887 RepID=UPI002D219B00|nr:accessory gland protein Acp29AB-like isoform X2 [Drosophila sulfurigaster albostrigata]
MNTLFVCLLASVLVVYGSEDESKQQETSCVNYCSNIINPMLNVTRNLQNQVNDFKHQTKCLSQFENTNKLMEEKFASLDKKIEQKLKDLSTASDQIMQQIKLQDKQVEQQLQHLHKADEVKKPIPGPPYQQIGSKYYYIEESEEVNWFVAVNKCFILGGSLISIENQDEFNAIKEKLQTDKDYWIGISDLAKEGKYVSVVKGDEEGYLNWHDGEPYNYASREHCVELRFKDNKHLMNVENCDTKQLFICEKTLMM